MDKRFSNLQEYKSLSQDSLENIYGGGLDIKADLNKLVSDGRDFLWGFRDGFEGRKRHHRSWRDRD